MTLISLAALEAAGNAWATPWSVMATALMPQAAARFTAAAGSVRASMEDIWVCRCSSTRFTGALSARMAGAWASWICRGSSSGSLL